MWAEWELDSQGRLSKEEDISAGIWRGRVWWGEFQAAGMVDSKLWGSERIREIPEGSWAMSEETDGKWTRTRLRGQEVRVLP